MGGGLEYTRSPRLKSTGRLEFRNGTSADTVLSTLGVAYKASQDWSILAENILRVSNRHGGTSGERVHARLRIGAAYRDTDTNVWSGLARYELRHQKHDGLSSFGVDRVVHILSLDANCQPRPKLIFSAGYAAKQTTDRSNGITTNSLAHLVDGRVTYDLTQRWDVGVTARLMLADGFGNRNYGLGAEVGYVLRKDLWLSLGYNAFGFHDDDLTRNGYADKGPFIRVRFKFDDSLMSGPSSSIEVSPPAGPSFKEKPTNAAAHCRGGADVGPASSQ